VQSKVIESLGFEQIEYTKLSKQEIELQRAFEQLIKVNNKKETTEPLGPLVSDK